MADLPRFPGHQLTTTRYDPSGRKSVSMTFRPKLTKMVHSNLQVDPGDLLSSGDRQAPLHRALHWLMYQEKQERAIIQSDALVTSPVQCYLDGDEKNDSWFLSRATREPPIITTEEELSKMIQKALAGVLWRTQRKTKLLHQLEEEEAFCRRRDLVEPMEQNWIVVGMVQELLRGKLMIWKDYLQQLEIWRNLISLVKEEKIARVSILCLFVSCANPLPCRCLLRDLEILEESAVPLEPEVNPICLFVSVILGGNEALQTELLAERGDELRVMVIQQRWILSALDTLDRVRHEEKERFDSMMQYHEFCVKLVRQHNERTCADSGSPLSFDGEPRQVWQQRRRWLPPSIDYYKYLHIVYFIHLENETRESIETCEFSEFIFLMYRKESACRCTVTSAENLTRRQVLVDMEALERHIVVLSEATTLQQCVRPRWFRHHARSMMRALQKKQTRLLQHACATTALTIIEAYENCRRGEIMLLETKLRTENRLLFHRSSAGGNICMVNRWMLQHELRVVTREEEWLRMRIADWEADNIATPATAHEWMVDFGHTALKIAREREHQRARSRLMEEEVEARDVMESLRLQESVVFFARSFCSPAPAGETMGNAAEWHDDQKMSPTHGLDIRQVVISSLNEFLSDHTLLTLFSNSPSVNLVM